MSNVALLVGVNKYQTPGNDLRGCVHDVASMRVLLSEHDFSVLHVRSLIDEQATKKRILGSLEQMVRNAKAGDHLVWHNSSHGSQVPTSDPHEPDFMTEVLCPYDFDWVSDRYISDDEVHDICAQLHPEATLDIFLDACHSGDMLREVGDPMPRFIPYLGEVKDTMKPFSLEKGQFWNVALWSGCKSDQTSDDACINGVWQGAFTWAIMRAMVALPFQSASPKSSRNVLIDVIKRELETAGYEQTPQLETSEEMRVKRVFE